MPEFIVELAFEFRSTYRVTASTHAQALAAANAQDDAHFRGIPVPSGLGSVPVAVISEREWTDDLDSRVFDETGEEVEFD